jgi:hypothetical protein
MLSAFFSVFFACKQQRLIGSFWLGGQTGSVNSRKWLRRKGSTEQCPVPRLSMVFLLSISKTFFDYALMMYIIGLGVYLGSVWQNNLDVYAGSSNSRNIFIVFMIYAGFCICVYCLLVYTDPYELNQWSENWEWWVKAKDTLSGLDCECGTRDNETVELRVQGGGENGK